MFDFSNITSWLHNLLSVTCGLGDFWTILIECILVGVCILAGYAILAIILIFMERKVCAWFQCRLGPMRVGPWGIFQVFADVLKMLIKEIFSVDGADKVLYYIAPFLVIIASVGTFSFLPWNNGAQVLDYTYLGAAQISVYAGGMVMMYIFAVQLVSKRTLQGLVERVKGCRALSYALICLVGLATVAGVQLKNGFISVAVEGKEVPMQTIGEALLGSEKYQYVLPFEFISVFLLACIIGAIVVARKEKEDK